MGVDEEEDEVEAGQQRVRQVHVLHDRLQDFFSIKI